MMPLDATMAPASFNPETRTRSEASCRFWWNPGYRMNSGMSSQTPPDLQQCNMHSSLQQNTIYLCIDSIHRSCEFLRIHWRQNP